MAKSGPLPIVTIFGVMLFGSGDLRRSLSQSFLRHFVCWVAPLKVLKASTVILAILCVAGCTLIAPDGAIQAPAATDTPLQTTTPSPGAAGIGDTYYLTLGNGGYDVQHYTLVMEVQPATNVISSTAIITAVATQPLSAFNLDFVGLTIDKVLVNGRGAQYSTEKRELVIKPAMPLLLDDKFTIVVVYHGSPEPIHSIGEIVDVGWFATQGRTINVYGEPDGAASWFPANNHPRDKATYRFEVTVPAPFTVAASGYLRQRLEHGDQITYIWEMDKPLASYLAAINIGNFELETMDGPNGVVIRSYFPPDFSRQNRQYYAVLPEVMDYLSTLFGDYPFEAYGVLIGDPESSLCKAMLGGEVQTMSTHCPDAPAEEEFVTVHELAHQWFGDSVSLVNWQDMWLKEGSATYAEWLWSERGKPASAVTELINDLPRQLIPTGPIAEPSSHHLANDAVYIGGAIVFHALRLQVGDELFFQILRTYTERYQYGNASTQDFIGVAEEVSGQSLDDFFQAWLYVEELPELPDAQ